MPQLKMYECNLLTMYKFLHLLKKKKNIGPSEPIYIVIKSGSNYNEEIWNKNIQFPRDSKFIGCTENSTPRVPSH